MPVPINHVEPVPRRIRAVLGGVTIVDTTSALYVWERLQYPQYYLPLTDIASGVLSDEKTEQHSPRGIVHVHGLQMPDIHRPHAARLLTQSTIPGLSGTVRLEWSALDAWFEEDEQ